VTQLASPPRVACYYRIMRSFEELERLWNESPAPTSGAIRLICVRKGDGAHECPTSATISVERGLEGDRWWHKPDRDVAAQITLMSVRAAELIAADHAPLHAAGDNFLVELDLAEASLPVGTRLRLGSALLEVSAKPHTGCKKFGERFGTDAVRWVSERKALRLRGVNCRVLEAGEVAVGDTVAIVAAPRV
jgi:MOSC domain-containing protein YiiM